MTIREEVSGVGANAKRTDLNVSQQPTRYIAGLEYGAGGLMDQQGGAPMAGGVPMPDAMDMPDTVELGAPTQFPEQPISYGSSWGPGPGLSSVVPQQPTLLSTVEKSLQYDTTGISEFLYNRLNK